jgi:hypothetical protein
MFLFAETGARFLLSCKLEHEAAVRSAIDASGLKITAAGVVGGDAIAIPGVASLSRTAMHSAWSSGLAQLFN